ncbi:MAG: hypothetical protein ACI828_000515 [Flavobacteriales bacterium]|jgi:hypothetical protein
MKTLKRTIALLGTLFFLSACAEKPQNDNHDDDGPNEEVELKAPANIISVTQADTLYQEYGSNRVGLIQNAQNVDKNGDLIDPDDARFVPATRALVVDYNLLKSYIAYIDQEAKDSKTTVKSLRIYLGKYPDNGYYSEKKPGSETVFLNPTTIFDGGNEASFAIQNNSDGSSTAVSVGSVLGTSKLPEKSNLVLKQSGPIQSLALDDLGQIPPPYSDKDDY